MTTEDQKIAQLNENRFQEKTRNENEKKIRQPQKIKIRNFEAGIFGLFAVAADFLDWLVIGSVPILGDVLDGVMFGIIGIWVINLMMRRYKLSTAIVIAPVGGLLVELIPLIGDLPPTWIGTIWLIYAKSYKIGS